MVALAHNVEISKRFNVALWNVIFLLQNNIFLVNRYDT